MSDRPSASDAAWVIRATLDQDDAEAGVTGQAVRRQCPVPGLEDMQGHLGIREEHRR
jgi:hypothetical protein